MKPTQRADARAASRRIPFWLLTVPPVLAAFVAWPLAAAAASREPDSSHTAARESARRVRSGGGALARKGPFWTETVTGYESVVPSGRLLISTRGAVTVQGTGEDRVRYSLAKKVRARTETEARRLLQQFRVQSSRSGELTSLSFLHPGEHEQTVELRASVPRTLKEVVVETHGGPVGAFDLAGALRAATGGGRMNLDRILGNITALTAGGEIVLGEVGGSIRCVSAGGPINAKKIGGEATVETAGGEIVVREVRGTVRASTSGGSIRIGQAGSHVVVTTAGGLIDVGQARGTVTADNLGGPIHVGSADGVRVETAGGTIRLGNVTGTLHASTGVGDIVARLGDRRAMRDSFLSTAAGDITVVIPNNLPLTIHAQNTSAGGVRRIVSEIPGIAVKVSGTFVVAEGKVLGGGPLLKLAGTGGTIFIKKEGKEWIRGE